MCHRQLQWGLHVPTITVDSARGLPHSFVSKARMSDSPTSREKKACPCPSPKGNKSAFAALAKTSIQADTFAANPSGLDVR